MAIVKTICFDGHCSDVARYVAGEHIEIHNSQNSDSERIISADLTDYYTKGETYTQQEVNDLIGGIEGITAEVVDELPQPGKSGVIYLVENEDGTYTQFMWIATDEEYVGIGGTDINLDNYYTKEEVEALLTSDAILERLGYREETLRLVDIDGNQIDQTILVKVENSNETN